MKRLISGRNWHFPRECQHGEQAGQSKHNIARLNTWLRPRQGRKGQLRQRARKLPSARSQDEQAERRRWSTWITTAHAAQSNRSQSRLGNEIQWLLDRRCTDHLINSEDYFGKCIDLKERVNIYLGDNRHIKATKIRNVVSNFNEFRKQKKIKMSNVFYAENINTNLISFGKLTDNNTIISKVNANIIDKNNEVIAVAYKENYKIKSILTKKT